MTWVFWIMINKTRKPKMTPKIHFKFIFFLLGCIVALRAGPNKEKLAKS